jgi:hypothetical protein
VEPLSGVASPRDCLWVITMGTTTVGLWHPSCQGSHSSPRALVSLVADGGHEEASGQQLLARISLHGSTDKCSRLHPRRAHQTSEDPPPQVWRPWHDKTRHWGSAQSNSGACHFPVINVRQSKHKRTHRSGYKEGRRFAASPTPHSPPSYP